VKPKLRIERTVRIPRRLYIELETAAADKGISINAEILERLRVRALDQSSYHKL